MARLNARCSKCGTVFPSGISVSNSRGISINNTRFGPCPNCGGSGPAIADNTNFDVIDERIIINRGRVSPQDLLQFASVLSTYRDRQENRAEVEAGIVSAFPQLRQTAPRLSNDAFLRLVIALLTLLSLWQTHPNSKEIVGQISQIVQEAEGQVELTLAEQYEQFEKGKVSRHALEKKISKIFPEIAAYIKDLPWEILSFFSGFLIVPFDRWYNDRRDRRILKDFVPTTEQNAEVIKALEDIKTAIQQNNTEALAEMRRLVDEVKARRE